MRHFFFPKKQIYVWYTSTAVGNFFRCVSWCPCYGAQIFIGVKIKPYGCSEVWDLQSPMIDGVIPQPVRCWERTFTITGLSHQMIWPGHRPGRNNLYCNHLFPMLKSLRWSFANVYQCVSFYYMITSGRYLTICRICIGMLRKHIRCIVCCLMYNFRISEIKIWLRGQY